MRCNFVCYAFLLSFISCSSTGRFIDKQLIKMKIGKTIDNQDYKKLKDEGNNFILGQFTVLYNGQDITELCSLGLNSTGGGGIGLGKTGRIIIPTKKSINGLYSLWCATGDDTPHFNYLFNVPQFEIKGNATYVGEIALDFTDIRRNDPNTKYQEIAPWIKSIAQTFDENKRNALEEKYRVYADSTERIRFK